MDALTVVTSFGAACMELQSKGHSVEQIALLAGDIPVKVVVALVNDALMNAYEYAMEA